MSSPRPHDFWIQREGARNGEWHWLAADANDVAEYSGSLWRQVKRDQITASSRVELHDGVTEDALKIIISSIPSKDDDGDLPALSISDRDPESGFEELLSLAIACWKYDCAIPPTCKKFAKDFHRNWTVWYGHDFFEGASGVDVAKAINWMFIALVFEWDRIFRNTSRYVVVRYKPNDNNNNLPQDFQELVGRTRNRKMQQAYSFVQKSWMSFYDPTNEMLNKIHAHFLGKFGIQLQDPLPDDMNKQANPDILLVEMAAVVKSNEGEGPRLPQSPLVYDGPGLGIQSHGTGRQGLFAPVAASVGRDLMQKAKKAMKSGHTARKPSSSSSEDSWKKTQSLEKSMNDFRTKSLDGIPFLDKDYLKLRNKHIKPSVSAVVPKIKRQ
ncbi:uncharacterized protein LY89DRAFT_663614 [Mollisia scopiformis]|uniref:Uncharacterized protein n=1 Tax=Mollisia scopiformis TaxID=149040 RepID=A0A194XSN2_MOLSC|nr:uncharacterized protein LY89DRAFT_663614 [Mollisia scopiformis]KUJ23151.1 hypothetical protein LY89DRAFT_663614 [Mollisia scopiformis]